MQLPQLQAVPEDPRIRQGVAGVAMAGASVAVNVGGIGTAARREVPRQRKSVKQEDSHQSPKIRPLQGPFLSADADSVQRLRTEVSELEARLAAAEGAELAAEGGAGASSSGEAAAEEAPQEVRPEVTQLKVELAALEARMAQETHHVKHGKAGEGSKVPGVEEVWVVDDGYAVDNSEVLDSAASDRAGGDGAGAAGTRIIELQHDTESSSEGAEDEDEAYGAPHNGAEANTQAHRSGRTRRPPVAANPREPTSPTGTPAHDEDEGLSQVLEDLTMWASSGPPSPEAGPDPMSPPAPRSSAASSGSGAGAGGEGADGATISL